MYELRLPLHCQGEKKPAYAAPVSVKVLMSCTHERPVACLVN